MRLRGEGGRFSRVWAIEFGEEEGREERERIFGIGQKGVKSRNLNQSKDPMAIIKTCGEIWLGKTIPSGGL